MLGAASGAVAGLVGITPAAGFVEPWAALVIGGIVGIACYFGLFIKSKMGFDDALDVVGSPRRRAERSARLLTGIFASPAINSARRKGCSTATRVSFQTQVIGIAAAWVFSFVVSFIFLKIIDAVMGLRVDEIPQAWTSRSTPKRATFWSNKLGDTGVRGITQAGHGAGSVGREGSQIDEEDRGDHQAAQAR